MKKIYLRKGGKLNKKAIIKLIVLCISLAIITVCVILYKQNNNVRILFDKYVFMKNANENDLPKIETDSKNIYAFKNSILVFKDNELKSYNKYGKEEYSINVEITNPMFRTCGDYICIAEENGSRFYFISYKNIIWEKQFKGSISNIAMNSHGQVAITTLGTTDKSVVSVFGPKGEELFSKHIAEDLVVDVAVSEDNKYLAIAKVNYSGINVKSTIETIDIKEAKNGNAVINEYRSDLGDLIINIEYDKKNSLVSMYDEYISIIKDNEIIKKADFKVENVIFAGINNKILKVVKSKGLGVNSKVELQMCNIESETKTVYEIEEPKSIYVFENIIAVNLGSEALFINNSGWLIKEYKSSQEIKNIVISNNLAGIIYKNKVEIISL